jgi:hypothetical protein
VNIFRDLSPIVAGVLVGIAAVVPVASAVGLTDQALLCGGTGNKIASEFDIGAAKDFWQIFPAALRAPELEEDAKPAHVIVFEGTVDLDAGNIVVVGNAAKESSPVLHDVVCVTQSDGTVNIYSNVSRAGSNFAQ